MRPAPTVRRRQRLIESQSDNGDVLLVRLEELPRLRHKPPTVRHPAERWQRNVGLGARLVLEVGVDRLPMDFLNHLHAARCCRRARTTATLIMRSLEITSRT